MRLFLKVALLLIAMSYACDKQNPDPDPEPPITPTDSTDTDIDSTNNPVDTTSLIVELDVVYPSNFWSEDGSITLNILGGAEPIDITWTKDGVFAYIYFYNTTSITNLETGMYFLSVSDSDSNQFETNIFLGTFDTIVPKEYLPAYPGSYWIYNDGDTMKVNSEYELTPVYRQLHDPPIYDDGHNEDYFPDDSLYLPIYNGYPVMGYEEVNHSIHSIPFIPIIIETVGSRVFPDRDNRSSCTAIMTESLDTTIQVGDLTFNNVIETFRWQMGEGQSCWAYPNQPVVWNYIRSFYAPGVGLIKEEEFVLNGDSSVKEIVDWHINNEL